MTTLVVGAGAMGRWVAQTVPGDVAFADTDPAAAEAAAATVGGRAVALDTDETFEAVCLAVPMTVVAQAIADHAGTAEQAIYDVTGEMATPVEAMREHAPDLERVSFHPLFAPENAPGNVPVVADSPGPVTDAVREAMTDAGNDVFETTVAEHDEAMRSVQAKAHAAILAYGLAADEVDDRFHTPVSAVLDDLVGQVTGGEEHVYASIQRVFGGAAEVADAASRIAAAAGDHDEQPDEYSDAFAALYREAGRAHHDSDIAQATDRDTTDETDESPE
ncbi:prephenate dehydrogenase/arogenate dehydrogenase family protein [Haloarchaeobius amylolyticus]|uniref:prephenate dehydrogenase/arogenate dehydrogenase family protein n=1 Tax=Haloarchaeobius amylolyticus TaxID=1198296 RepID=UPI00226EA5B9|nr:prephenate dehydrogenase/arogenate dehydrogenase family protein [Haloarchaeobius amylolyticus]